jgi:hypothetical protein
MDSDAANKDQLKGVIWERSTESADACAQAGSWPLLAGLGPSMKRTSVLGVFFKKHLMNAGAGATHSVAAE